MPFAEEEIDVPYSQVKSGFVALMLIAGPPVFAQQSGESAAIKTFSDKDNGQTVHIKRGDLFDVRLPGNMTTGYGWTVKSISGKAVQSIGEIKYKPETTDRVGAGGEFLAHFKAAAAGKSTVKLAYARPWEKGVSPAKEFTLDVKVAGKTKE